MADQQLPPALAGDERFAILCELLAEEFASLDMSPMLVYLVDIVPPQVLPHLADQFHVMGLEGWRHARNVDEQRALIKRAIQLHRHKGTPWAVEQALLTVLGLSCQLTEWFEYGGRPYRFRLSIKRTGSELRLDEQRMAALFQVVHEYKNTRSRLEKVSLTQQPQQCLILATVTQTASTVRIDVPAPVARIASAVQRMGCVQQLALYTTVQPSTAFDVHPIRTVQATYLQTVRITTIEAIHG